MCHERGAEGNLFSIDKKHNSKNVLVFAVNQFYAYKKDFNYILSAHIFCYLSKLKVLLFTKNV